MVVRWPARKPGGPTRVLGRFVHAVAGSAPNANKSAARLSIRASGAGADGAVADAAVDTAIPQRRHAASTSKLDAAANGSLAPDAVDRRRGSAAVSPALTRGRESPPISSADAKSKAAQLMSAPAR